MPTFARLTDLFHEKTSRSRQNQQTKFLQFAPRWLKGGRYQIWTEAAAQVEAEAGEEEGERSCSEARQQAGEERERQEAARSERDSDFRTHNHTRTHAQRLAKPHAGRAEQSRRARTGGC